MAQLRLIFRVETRNTPILVYVQPCKPAPGKLSVQEDGAKRHVTDDDIEMFRVRRHLKGGRRVGVVTPLTSIWRAVELIPVFGKECDKTWTSSSAVELCQEFYVNSFSEKEVYQSVY